MRPSLEPLGDRRLFSLVLPPMAPEPAILEQREVVAQPQVEMPSQPAAQPSGPPPPQPELPKAQPVARPPAFRPTVLVTPTQQALPRTPTSLGSYPSIPVILEVRDITEGCWHRYAYGRPRYPLRRFATTLQAGTYRLEDNGNGGLFGVRLPGGQVDYLNSRIVWAPGPFDSLHILVRYQYTSFVSRPR